MNDKTESPVVAEIRARAMRISKRYGNDPVRYLKHLKAAQRAHAGRIVRQLTVV